MRVSVDQDLCFGCGLCAGSASDVFEVDDKSVVYGEITDELRPIVLSAIENCPAQAILEELD